MVNKVVEWLALTRTERRVLTFLSVTLAIGAGIRTYRAMSPEPPAFDYGRSDSTFAALSAVGPTAADTTADDPDEPLVNINTATGAELQNLPGVGPAIAGRILVYRTDHGPFMSVDQLRKVKGIGTTKLQRLRPHITLSTPMQRKSSP